MATCHICGSSQHALFPVEKHRITTAIASYLIAHAEPQKALQEIETTKGKTDRVPSVVSKWWLGAVTHSCEKCLQHETRHTCVATGIPFYIEPGSEQVFKVRDGEFSLSAFATGAVFVVQKPNKDAKKVSWGFTIAKNVVTDERGLHVSKKDAREHFSRTSLISNKTFVSVTPAKVYTGYPATVAYVAAEELSKPKWSKLSQTHEIIACSQCGRNMVSYAQWPTRGLSDTSYCVCPECEPKTLRSIYYKSKLVSFEGTNPPPETDTKPRTCGIEIECNPSYTSQLAVAGWRVPGIDDPRSAVLVTATEDNSLRKSEHGSPVEFVSPILSENSYEEWVTEFCKRINSGQVDLYNRCSFHEHFGADDFDEQQWYRTLLYLSYHQHEAFSFVSPSRATSHFCKPFPEFASLPWSFANISEMFMYVYGDIERAGQLHGVRRVPKFLALHDMHSRYYWVNMHSRWFMGTIEVRLHHGTTKAVDIINWTRLWLSVLNHCLNLPPLNNTMRTLFRKQGPDALPEAWRMSLLDVAPLDVRTFYRKRAKLMAASAHLAEPVPQ